MEDKLTMEKVKIEKWDLSAPWVNYYKAVNALFARDPQVKISYDNNNGVYPEIFIRVDDLDKADALAHLLPTEKDFGNVTLRINVIPPNHNTESGNLFKRAFDGNQAMMFVRTMTLPDSSKRSYVVFDKSVVQYYIDDLSDLHGNRSTLYQELAKEVFGPIQDISFCTDSTSYNASKYYACEEELPCLTTM